MLEVTIPPLPRRPGLRAIILATHDIGGTQAFSVTADLKGGRPPRRWWFPDKQVAWAHALELADTYCLALLDMSADLDGE